jgi:hypothetical protein
MTAGVALTWMDGWLEGLMNGLLSDGGPLLPATPFFRFFVPTLNDDALPGLRSPNYSMIFN